MKMWLPSGMSRGSTATLRRYESGRDGPGANEMPGGGLTYLTPAPPDQPPRDSGKVSAPEALRQNPPVRQYGASEPTPNLTPVAPFAVNHPPAPTLSMWYGLPSSPIPSPSIDSPRAEYNQSILCAVASPGALTGRPTNHDSSAG